MTDKPQDRRNPLPQIILIILGIACAVYGVLIMMVNSGTLFFAVWYVLAILFFFLAWTLRKGLRQRIPKAIRIIGDAVAVLLVVWLIVALSLIARGFNERPEEDLDYVVVLGAQVRESGPSTVLRYRLDTACTYLEENPDTLCIVTGAQGFNEPFTEAEGMRNYLLAQGIDESRIIMEPKAENTAQNIAYSKAIIDRNPGSVGVVTNNFHMYRALRLCEEAGLDACGMPAPSHKLYLPNNLLRESLGLTKDILVGNI